jgi:hypothetical protein
VCSGPSWNVAAKAGIPFTIDLNMTGYIFIALLFVLCCIMISLYISGIIAAGNRFYMTGLRILFLSWISGLILLGIALIYS